MSIKILTVDDSKANRLIINKAFADFDCEIFEGANGLEGLAAATREKPDLIILDIVMPVMGGVETLATLKADPSLESIPVMMLTAEAGRDTALRLIQLGIRDYIIKPFKREELIEKVGRIVQLMPRIAAKPKKAKTLDDVVRILVVDDKPNVIRLLSEKIGTDQWKIVGQPTAADAIKEATETPPDAILISLAVPAAGFALLQKFRASPNTKDVPIFAMCVKTEVELQAQAEKMPFTGVVTKPLDMEALRGKLFRAMQIDASGRFFTLDDDIQFLTFAETIQPRVLGEVERSMEGKIRDLVESGLSKFIMDLSKVAVVDVPFLMFIIATVATCASMDIQFRIVGNPTVNRELKLFKETSDLTVDLSIDEAKTRFTS